MSEKKSVYETLSIIDVSHKMKQLQGNNYLPWSVCKSILKKNYPEAQTIVHLNNDQLPYFVGELGVFVRVSVIVEGVTETEDYAVMNGGHKALKITPYSYRVKDYKSGQMVERHVAPALSTDVINAKQRAFVKACASHGLGINIYKGEPNAEIELVGSAELQAIMDKVKEKGIPLKTLCQTFNVTKPSEIWLQTFDAVIDYLEQV